LGAALIAEQGLRAISMELQEHTLTAQLAKRDSSAFEEVFKMYFKNLHAYACTILKEEADAEEAVQQVFFKLWERAEHLSFSGSVAAYLYRAVHNQCLNQLKHQKVKANHQLHVAYSMKNESVNGPAKMISKELEQKIREALNELPEQCRTVFQLSRFEDMKYREIADQLDISIKTVENQMGKALKQLRLKLVDFLTLLFLFIQF
jgi:RNA polymerase sigma-70 factor (ECF subfamily)